MIKLDPYDALEPGSAGLNPGSGGIDEGVPYMDPNGEMASRRPFLFRPRSTETNLNLG